MPVIAKDNLLLSILQTKYKTKAIDSKLLLNETERLEQKFNISKYVKFNISYSKQRQNDPSDLRVQKSC